MVGLFDSSIMKTIGTIIEYEENKKSDQRMKESQERLRQSSYDYSAQSIQRARSLYGKDEPLGYLRPSAFISPEWKEYLTKEQWLREAHTDKRFHLWNSDDLNGWNKAWGDPLQEYHKWCDKNDIPNYRRHLVRFFQNPPLSVAAQRAIDEKKKAERAEKEKEEFTTTVIAFLVLLVVTIIVCNIV